MSGEADAIARSERPATVTSLVADLRSLGVEDGCTVMVHTSLSALGFVVGGAQAVVAALLQVVGPTGTLMMPTHSGALTDPATWENPPVPESWWQTIRDEMPAFDADLTPTRMMGQVAECFRRLPGVKRSDHPTVSAAAIGPNAELMLDGHDLADGLGEPSPQSRLYDLDGMVLLLGVDHGNNTSLHLAEYRSGVLTTQTRGGSPILVDGERVWAETNDFDADEDDFGQLGEAFAVSGNETRGTVGAGTARLVRCREIVDFGITWLQANRTPS